MKNHLLLHTNFPRNIRSVEEVIPAVAAVVSEETSGHLLLPHLFPLIRTLVFLNHPLLLSKELRLTQKSPSQKDWHLQLVEQHSKCLHRIVAYTHLHLYCMMQLKVKIPGY